jgi:predicted acylesterase/phospholipase RssA
VLRLSTLMAVHNRQAACRGSIACPATGVSFTFGRWLGPRGNQGTTQSPASRSGRSPPLAGGHLSHSAANDRIELSIGSTPLDIDAAAAEYLNHFRWDLVTNRSTSASSRRRLIEVGRFPGGIMTVEDLQSANGTSRSPESLGVAISGGGVRAAFFALGALLYLVHTDLHRHIRLVSSVSGGSIVNVAVALDGDLTEADAVRFGRLVGRASNRMAKKGVFFWPGLRSILLSILILTLWAPLIIALGNVNGTMDGWDWDFFWFGEVSYTGLMVICLLLYLVLGRQSIQQNAYNAFLRHVTQEKGRRSRRKRKLCDLPESTVSHVVCATELTSGQPFYMSRNMMLSPLYGRSRPDISLPKAIYASAAFPIGFPPLRLRARNLDLTDGQDDEPPRTLMLSDGGVFNNLGTETFSANDAPAHIFLPDPSLPIIPEVARQLVVNASSPPKKTKLSSIPIWRSVTSSARIMSVMYENTLRPRVQRLIENQGTPSGPIVVDISESPVELVDRLAAERPESDDVRTRALEMRERLTQRQSVHGWKVYADRAARTKTVLSAVGRTAAVRLLRLGYLDTAISCHAHFATPGIGVVPDEKWFKELMDGTLSDQRLAAPAEEVTRVAGAQPPQLRAAST